MTRRGEAVAAALAVWVAALCGGCPSEVQPDPTLAELGKARNEIARLKAESQLLAGEIRDLRRTLANLRGIQDTRMEKLNAVQRIGLGSATGGVDLDGAPGDDGVKVVVNPVDQHGSVIKAAGTVTIQLFDLAADPNANLLAKAAYDVDETARHWASGFVAHYYSFTCRWGKPPAHEELTLRVTFLDYLSGKEHVAQDVVKVALPPPPAAKP
ncbi:MAG TPA: hypothetical protein VM695_03160 [Phycisphaerae bacterium]|nr:hypothetical protein [Phycisphaerae bacterium]